MPKRQKLTEKLVKNAQPVEGKDYQLFDSELRAFALMLYRSGSKAFTIDYRHAGRPRRMVLGRWPEWSVSAARIRAKELRRDVDAGYDQPKERKEFKGTNKNTGPD